MTKKIRVLIADDHPIVRQGMAVILAAQPDMELIAEATNGQEAVDLAQEFQPDIIIMDLKMPVKNGLTAIKEIDHHLPDTGILVLTSFPDDDSVFTAIKSGAMGFLLKDYPPDQLLDAIRTVYAGESALHPTIARKLMQEIKKPPVLPPSPDPLTPRELDVLQCLAQGLSNREIATELSVSTRTVTTHVRNILDKLHLANRTQAALYAYEKGIT
ncbi:MAG: response regulator transcription factor [Anaerolineae bacterium]|nr:response regulator transcription factor [Anaerolineae bacterium]